MGRVVFDSVTKSYDGVVAVSDLSCTVDDGEFFVLLGPSGCGKSTALRMVAGLEEITSGTISIGDQVVNEVEPKDRDIAMVFQSYALYPHMSVRKNIEFPLRTRDVAKDERNRLVEQSAKSLGLESLLDRKPAQLSGGQRQRVALARAIVRRPSLFLMDEPLSNLDAKLRVQTRAEIVELQRELDTTLIYVTHDQIEAMTMGDRIAIMLEGRLQQVGPPQAVYERPANVFVAGFIGTPPMNTFAGRSADGGVIVGDDRLDVAPSLAALLPAGEVVVGVRPERIAIGTVGGLRATVSVVESLGHERHLHCTLSTGDSVIVRQSASEPAPGIGSAVHLQIDPESVHVFDQASGLRIDHDD